MADNNQERAPNLTPCFVAQIPNDPSHTLNTFLDANHTDRKETGDERIARIYAQLQELDRQLDPHNEQNGPQ
ncbi:uncharacterized protein TrAFT101_004854 [Trichoderma asperellum]|uniref:uncharacterized protein n=1 Tax=Trichoderma asperellum TaxID=101201 RepID=UPI003328802B|nr:hypothetical protein TrAFT101_004854 [Trichoderma asperellum]